MSLPAALLTARHLLLTLTILCFLLLLVDLIAVVTAAAEELVKQRVHTQSEKRHILLATAMSPLVVVLLLGG
jgi:membrane-bound acyltransferase YfiQ involved in biofilm formation